MDQLKLQFRTKVTEVKDLGIEMSPGTNLVKFNQKSYIVGEMISEEKTDFELSKQTMAHKIAIYLAIAKILQFSSTPIIIARIDLALNIPLNLYKNEQMKSEFAHFIENNNDVIGLSVDGVPFSFRINSVLLLPEAMGLVYQRTDEFREQRVISIDIGSLNTSYLEFSHLIPQYNLMSVSNLGVNILRGQMAEALSTKFGVLVTDDDAQQILIDGCLILNGKKQTDSQYLIDQMLSQHLEQILNFAKSRKLSFSNTQIVFVGGGSLLLQKQIHEQLPYAIVAPDAQFCNVTTFLIILEAKSHART